MGMFRCAKDVFLLCYDGMFSRLEKSGNGTISHRSEFGLYIDHHGDPITRMGRIEWEGKAERVAWHSCYVLLFNSRFIEIRDIESGRLVQIIHGNDIRCTWDGRGTDQPQPMTWDGVLPREPRVHGVMNAEVPQRDWNGATTQRVFELIPKVQMFLPGSLASPSRMSRDQSCSPLHSSLVPVPYSLL